MSKQREVYVTQFGAPDYCLGPLESLNEQEAGAIITEALGTALLRDEATVVITIELR